MGDRVARAVGAGETIRANGKAYRLRPIPIRHLKELERRALEDYKRECLRTYAESAKMLGDRAQSLIESRVDEVSRWSLHDLPTIEAFDSSRVPINEAVRKWLDEQYPTDERERKERSDDRLRALLNDALDTGDLTPEELKEWTGVAPRRGRVRYDQWWVTATMAGRMLFVLTSVQVEQPDVTEAEIDDWPIGKLVEASRIVERLASADLGNG